MTNTEKEACARTDEAGARTRTQTRTRVKTVHAKTVSDQAQTRANADADARIGAHNNVMAVSEMSVRVTVSEMNVHATLGTANAETGATQAYPFTDANVCTIAHTHTHTDMQVRTYK